MNLRKAAMNREDLNAQTISEITLSYAWFTRRSQQFAKVPVSSPPWRALVILNEHGPMRIGDLAKLEGYSPANATALIKQLLNEGFIEKVPDPADARSKLLHITPKGRKQQQAWQDRLGTGLLPAFQDLSPEELNAIEEAVPVLRKLKQRFEEDRL